MVNFNTPRRVIMFKLSKLNNPKETTGLTSAQTGLYHAGYIKGVQDRD